MGSSAFSLGQTSNAYIKGFRKKTAVGFGLTPEPFDIPVARVS